MRQQLNDIIERITARFTIPIPDEAICSECNKIRRDYKDYGRILEERQIDEGVASRATCHCVESKAEAEKQARLELVRRLLWADLPHSSNEQTFRTFANFKFRKDQPRKKAKTVMDALESAKALAAGTTSYHVLTISGKVGSGKSHLLEAIGREVIERNRWAKYCFVPDLLNALRPGNNTGGIEDYLKADVLLLDDVGAEKETAWTDEQLMVLVDHFYREGKTLAVATNVVPDTVRGSRLYSRLGDKDTGAAKVDIITAGDYRSKGAK